MINFQLEQAGFISRKLHGLQDHIHHDLAAVRLGNSISESWRADHPPCPPLAQVVMPQEV
jgi:hypothetical protein